MARHFWITSLFLPAIASVILLTAYGTTSAASSKISPALQKTLLQDVELVDVVAFLAVDRQTDFPQLAPLRKEARRPAAHAAMLNHLQQSSVAGSDFIGLLSELEQSGQVNAIRSFWIADVVAFQVSPGALEQIADHPELHYLVEDVPLELVAPVMSVSSVSDYAGASPAVEITGVRELWNMGFTGRGRIVCGFDTGVEGTHPALAENWLGNRVPTDFGWYDPYGSATPIDLNGHGTHTMGIMAGRAGADTIGVAFNANWMAAAVVDRGQNLSKTVSDIIAAFQWAADPDGDPNTVDDLPDVISNSWGIPKGLYDACDQTFWQAIDNLEALGVVTIFACGNEGPNPATIRNPADRASSPTNSFSVGAVDQSQAQLPIAHFSSRGPANCDPTIIKPEIVAPGVALRSSYKNGTYRLISGTSMAAPFVAGCVALLREYNPDATVEEIKNALMMSATDLGQPGEDNEYGWGFINVRRALDHLPKPSRPYLSVEQVRVAQSSSGRLMPGNTSELELVAGNAMFAAGNVTAVLRSNCQHAYILKSDAGFGSVLAEQTTNNYGDAFLVKLDHSARIGDPVSLSVEFYSDLFGYINTSDIRLIAGQPVFAGEVDVATEHLSYSVSNYGRGNRWRDLTTGADLLNQLSLVIGTESAQVYDGFPGNLDFVALDSIAVSEFGNMQLASTRFRTHDDVFEISSEVSTYPGVTTGNFVLLQYELLPQPGAATEVAVALALDFDLPGGEELTMDGHDILFRALSQERYVGIRALPSQLSVAQSMMGSVYKSGNLSDNDKLALLGATETNLSSETSDMAVIISLTPGEGLTENRLRFGFVIACGATPEEIASALQKGEARYNQATSADDRTDNPLPLSFEVAQNYPNPFNAQTRIDFNLNQAQNYRLDIFNAIGRLIRSFVSESPAVGTVSVVWDGRDQAGHDAASGVYFYRLSSGSEAITRKMVLLK